MLTTDTRRPQVPPAFLTLSNPQALIANPFRNLCCAFHPSSTYPLPKQQIRKRAFDSAVNKTKAHSSFLRASDLADTHRLQAPGPCGFFISEALLGPSALHSIPTPPLGNPDTRARQFVLFCFFDTPPPTWSNLPLLFPPRPLQHVLLPKLIEIWGTYAF